LEPAVRGKNFFFSPYQFGYLNSHHCAGRSR
jgi:hypothetical protein